MRINTLPKDVIIIVLTILTIGLFTSVVYSVSGGVWNMGYQVDTGDTYDVEIGNAIGSASSDQCGRVTNAAGKDLFVPTRTTAEWASLRDNEPIGVTAVDTGAKDTCASLGYECGFHDDNCGGAINCGSCGVRATCPAGTCVCDAGWDDCDGDNACECDLGANECSVGFCVAAGCANTPDWAGNGPAGCTPAGPWPGCGTLIGQPCPTVGQIFACGQGLCAPSLNRTLPLICQCPSGWADCDADPSCCETQLGTIANCLSCGDACGGGETCEATGCEVTGGVWVNMGGGCLPPGHPPCEPYFCPAEEGQPCSPIGSTRCCKSWCASWWGQYALQCQ